MRGVLKVCVCRCGCGGVGGVHVGMRVRVRVRVTGCVEGEWGCSSVLILICPYSII